MSEVANLVGIQKQTSMRQTPGTWKLWPCLITFSFVVSQFHFPTTAKSSNNMTARFSNFGEVADKSWMGILTHCDRSSRTINSKYIKILQPLETIVLHHHALSVMVYVCLILLFQTNSFLDDIASKLHLASEILPPPLTQGQRPCPSRQLLPQLCLIWHV